MREVSDNELSERKQQPTQSVGLITDIKNNEMNQKNSLHAAQEVPITAEKHDLSQRTQNVRKKLRSYQLQTYSKLPL